MLNTLSIHGRLVRDPQVRQTTSGKSVATFTVAVDRDMKKPDGTRDTDFFDVVARNALADFAGSYLHKGQEVIVSGRMEMRRWQDKQGNSRISWELQALNTEFCGSKQDSPSSGASAPPSPRGEGYDAPAREYPVMAETDGDLPF